MPKKIRSILALKDLSVEDVLQLFKLAHSYQSSGWPDLRANPNPEPSRVVCLLFFEPSTRTRMSFQIASYRLGMQVQTMELGAGSSLAKGETVEDTILNFSSMQPDLMVVRHNGSREVDRLLSQLPMPVLSAGSGSFSHPTQGLLDAYTLWSKWGHELAGKKILIVGDIKHSRVAASAMELLPRLGCQLAFSGPSEWLPDAAQSGEVKYEHIELHDGLAWCDAVMGLRVQFERHQSLKSLSESDRLVQVNRLGHDYHQRFGLTADRLTRLKPSAFILHPGPINYGVEFSDEVAQDPRSVVLEQVRNGVFVRAALLKGILTEDSLNPFSRTELS